MKEDDESGQEPAQLSFGLLGPVEAHVRTRRVRLGGVKQRSLLAVLLLQANHVVPVGRIIDDLWGDNLPARPVRTLWVYVSHLRNALDPDRLPGQPPQVILTRPPGYL